MVRKPDATMEPAPQDIQLMSKHRVLSFKPYLRLEWRGQNETEQPDHSASLGDSIASSTRIRFSVRTRIRWQRAERGWKRPCDDPAPLPHSRKLVALEDASNGSMLFAKMGVSRQVEREFDPSRKDTHWGRRELARDR
jgi:hypothetical protein